MKNIDDSLSTYIEDTGKMREQFLDRKNINRQNLIKKGLIRGMIGLDYALPFIIAGAIVCGKYNSDKNFPFVKDNVLERADVEIMDNSLGMHSEKVSYDYTYKNLSFEHSTGWKKDENGLYERTVTVYGTEGIDLSNSEEIFSLSEKEISDKFTIENIKTIKKSELASEDKLYDQACFTIVRHEESMEEFITREETTWENIGNTSGYFIYTLLGGLALTGVKRLFLKTYVKDKLKDKEKRLVFISEEDISEIEELLKIRNQNINLFENDCEVVSYQLRKKR